jgi:hypothetical protein
MARTEHPDIGRATREDDAGEAPLQLRCLRGKPTPAGLASDVRGLTRLPDAAREALWSVLGPCLAEPPGADAESMLDAFCRTHRLRRDDLATAIKACRFLLREAAGAGVARGVFVQDLRALCGKDDVIEQFFVAGYDAACNVVRQEVLQGTLADHGKLLMGVDWRLDSVQASNRGSKMRVPVALLTLRYREGDETKRITLQVLPETLRQLTQTLTEIAP